MFHDEMNLNYILRTFDVGTWKYIMNRRLPSEYLGDNRIQNFHVGRYIVEYT